MRDDRARPTKTREQPLEDRPEEERDKTQPAEERGERLETGKRIHRGGKARGEVPGASEADA